MLNLYENRYKVGPGDVSGCQKGICGESPGQARPRLHMLCYANVPRQIYREPFSDIHLWCMRTANGIDPNIQYI